MRALNQVWELVDGNRPMFVSWFAVVDLNNLFNFGCAESVLLCKLCSGCGEWGLLSSCRVGASEHLRGFSCCRARVLGCSGRSTAVPGLWSTGSVAPVTRSPPRPRIDPVSLHWQVDSLPQSHQGSPGFLLLTQLLGRCKVSTPGETGEHWPQSVNRELPDVQAEFRKGRGTRDQIANIRWIIEKAREFQKNIYLFIALLTTPKPLTV